MSASTSGFTDDDVTLLRQMSKSSSGRSIAEQVEKNEGEQSMEREGGGGECSDEKFTMFKTKGSRAVLRDFLGYGP